MWIRNGLMRTILDARLLLKRTMYLSDFNAKAISEAVPDPPTPQATMTSLSLLHEDRRSVGFGVANNSKPNSERS
jgi:hypothetical protein